MSMAYDELLLQNSIRLLEKKIGWLIDVNLAIVYLLTNFFYKKIIIKII